MSKFFRVRLNTAGSQERGEKAKGCDECNRTEVKPWSIFTIDYHGVECCAKCLTPMSVPRKKAGS